MSKNKTQKYFFLCVFLFFFIFISLNPEESFLFSNPLLKNTPAWWQIKIQADIQGIYQIKERQTLYFGYYCFSSSVRGSMEKDEDDFLLYQEAPKDIKWEAQETAIFPDRLKMLTTAEFIEKPDIKLNYLLKRGDLIYIDLIINGFTVPQNRSIRSLFLELPASKENSQIVSNINYNAFVKNGSNDIKIKKKDIYSKALEKNFKWKWKYQKWQLAQQTNIYFSHSHNVKVNIKIIPHW
jgi:hypothetical protein